MRVLGLVLFVLGVLFYTGSAFAGQASPGCSAARLLDQEAEKLAQKGDFSGARALMEKALKLCPGDRVLLYNLGLIYLRVGNYAEACSRLERLYQEGDREVDLLNNLAWCHYKLGDPVQGLIYVAEGVKLHPGHKELLRTQEELVLALKGSAAESSGGGEALDDILARLSPKGQKEDHAYAVVVGISRYASFEGPRFAVRDAQNFRRVLTTLGPFPEDPAHVKMLLNQAATYTEVVKAVRWLLEKGRLHPEARLLFYFSGHGAPVVDKEGKVADGALLPYDASLEALELTALKVSWLRREFSALKNKKVILIADACFTGLGERSVSRLRPAVLRIDESVFQTGKPFIVAASRKPARDFSEGRQGAFTYFFLKALLGAGDTNGDGWVDAVEAFRYAKKRLAEFDFEQDPAMTPEVPVKLVKVR